ncbi:putative helicase CHR10, partial [Mucuna pruriens]
MKYYGLRKKNNYMLAHVNKSDLISFPSNFLCSKSFPIPTESPPTRGHSLGHSDSVTFGAMNLSYEQRLQVVAKIILDNDACAGDAPPCEEELGLRATATLKPHQVEGVSWLIRRYKLGVNVILGEIIHSFNVFDCSECLKIYGTGKDFASYLLFKLFKMVICPLSVTDGWVSEIIKFTPKLEVFKYVGDKEYRCNLRMKIHEHVTRQSSTLNVLLPFDVLLTSYDIALMDQDFLSQIPWQYAIIDEAQRLKNPSSVLFNVLKDRYIMPRRLLMTGTPIQNNLSELWALVYFCMPSVFGTVDKFLSTFKDISDLSSVHDVLKVKERLKILRSVLGAFMLRRTKSKLIECGNLVLPPLTETTVLVPLVILQKKVYMSILRKELHKLLALSSGTSNHHSLQNIVLQLRKTCSHPYLFPGIEPEPYEEGEHLVQDPLSLFWESQLSQRRNSTGKIIELVELWFLGQEFHDHLKKQEAEIPEENRAPWLKLDYQLCAILWQFVSPELLEILRLFKTCYSFWTNARDVFANDAQHLFDSTQKIVSLQRTNHDMVLHIAKARAAAEELKGLLACNSVEETTKQIDKLLMVLILRSMHPDYEHVWDQILSSEQIPSMNSLVTRLLRVLMIPTITKGDGIVVENFAMVASRGRGRSGHNTRGMSQNGKGGCGNLVCSHCGKEGHLQNKCYDLIGWPDKTANISSSDIPSNGRTGSQLISDEKNQEFLRLKSNNHAQSIGQVFLSSSINLNFVLYIPKCSYNLISESIDSTGIRASWLGKDMNQEDYYLSNNPSMLCFAFVSPKLLHNRLGHSNLAKLKLMVPSLNKLSTLDCESC